jgi:Holliday junction DNA helicase RuvB
VWYNIYNMKFRDLFPKCKDCSVSSIETTLFKTEGGLYCQRCLSKKIKPSNNKPNEELVFNWNELVTPKTFEDYIGQEPIKKELNTMLAATAYHKIPVQHVLFSGSFGLGKTTIAKIFARNIGDNEIITGVNIQAPNFPSAQAVVVDEIHTIQDEEWLLSVMDKSKQTILGATTTAGRLSGPLRSRFVSLVLQPYTDNEMKRIILGASKNLKYNCQDYVAEAVAKRGKTTARVGLFLFKRIYDRLVLNNYQVTPKLLAEWFKEMNIDSDGLDNADRAYINCLSDKPVGLQNLSAVTGFDRITLEEAIEPYLLTRGFVKRTPRGRVLGDRKVLPIWT